MSIERAQVDVVLEHVMKCVLDGAGQQLLLQVHRDQAVSIFSATPSC
jgi:hypothetical protein